MLLCQGSLAKQGEVLYEVLGQGLVQHLVCAVPAAPAATGDLELRTESFHAANTGFHGLANIPVGYAVTDTNVHKDGLLIVIFE